MLMIAAAFPPTGGSGVQRPAKFAKYLPAFGWSPIVWASGRMHGLPEDATLLADLPSEVTIHRWNRGLAMRRWQRRLRGLGDRVAGLSRITQAVDWRVESWIADRAWPDDCAAWAKTSVAPLRRLIRGEGVDAIYSTYSPASNHLLALDLKTATHRPWIADFRDLWTDECRYDEVAPDRRRADRELEQTILEKADVVIGVSPRQTEILAGHVPSQRAKFVTMTNGFDPDDFRSPCREKTDEAGARFVLAYVGRFDRYRVNAVLLDGFRRFATLLGPERDRFVFRVVGHATEDTRAKVTETGLPCEFTGPVQHAEAIREMTEADALLVSTADSGPNADSVIVGKTFEYLASGRPILCVGPRDGECERIVRSCKAGLTVSFDAPAIAAALNTLFDGWRSGRPLGGCAADRLEPYSRATLTRRLAQLLDGLTEPSAKPGATSREPVAIGAP